jgi:hypothetical protein
MPAMNPILSTVLIVLGVVALVAAVTWTLAGRWLRHQRQRWRWHATSHDAPTTQQAAPSAPKRVIVPPPLSSLPPPTMSVKRRHHSDDTPTQPMAHVSALSTAPARSSTVDVALHV